MRIGEFGPKANRFLELYNCTVEIVQPAKHDTKITEALAVSGSKSQASSKAVAASRNRP